MVEGLLIKEGDLLEFELTAERALRVTVMKSSTVTRKPKKLGVPELQANMAKKKGYRGLPPNMLMPGQEAVAMSDLLLPAAAAAAAQGLPIRLPDVNATQVQAYLWSVVAVFLLAMHSSVTAPDAMLHVQMSDLQSVNARQSTQLDMVSAKPKALLTTRGLAIV